jgi:hypothetical protein
MMWEEPTPDFAESRIACLLAVQATAFVCGIQLSNQGPTSEFDFTTQPMASPRPAVSRAGSSLWSRSCRRALLSSRARLHLFAQVRPGWAPCSCVRLRWGLTRVSAQSDGVSSKSDGTEHRPGGSSSCARAG